MPHQLHDGEVLLGAFNRRHPVRSNHGATQDQRQVPEPELQFKRLAHRVLSSGLNRQCFDAEIADANIESETPLDAIQANRRASAASVVCCASRSEPS